MGRRSSTASLHIDPRKRGSRMSKLFQYAGIAASVVLIAFGIGATVIGFSARDRVATELGRELISRGRFRGCDGRRGLRLRRVRLRRARLARAAASGKREGGHRYNRDKRGPLRHGAVLPRKRRH